jgi:hypothetical protein
VKLRAPPVKESLETMESYEKMIHYKNLEKIIGEEGERIMNNGEKVSLDRFKKY